MCGAQAFDFCSASFFEEVFSKFASLFVEPRRIYCVSTSRQRIVVPVNYFVYFIIVLRYLSTILFIIVFFYYISRASSM